MFEGIRVDLICRKILIKTGYYMLLSAATTTRDVPYAFEYSFKKYDI